MSPEPGPRSAPVIPFVRASGTAYEAGLCHGRALSGALRSFLDDRLARLGHLLPRPVTLEALRPVIAAHDAVITAALPELAEEITGLAEGAGITREEAVLLQIRRELLGYRTVRTSGDCTTYARTGTGAAAAPVLAQTVDLNGNLDDRLAVLDITRAGGRQSLLLSFGGLLGYLGINNRGLAVGLNLVLGGEWRPGVPPYLAIRHLLDTADSVADAVAIIRELPLASSRSFMLCDRRTTAWVEVLGDEIRTMTGDRLEHTNHFLHPDLAPGDRINPFARRSSVRRLEACRRGQADLPPSASAEDHFSLLSTPPLHVPGNGDIRKERTVAAVVMLPAQGELHVRPADVPSSETQSFRATPDARTAPEAGVRRARP
ncbi:MULTISPECIES: C45 family peptidase [unclassified Streptomyces]|uniref:C45 family autoproteolytic acyltransferase/hydolase n=1 Tax=unclassified Streptomyces TaxID=2593676 RepID=UPI002258B9B6|nr:MULTISPECIES: C45 family peptidase [unclassified Streptomyces]MCX5141193.1 C45 family peptidase [Streptomyces sp. NBC_00338]WRZ65712.1 C45 family peptidase [Streptomyces sp. NBC_01257]